MSDMLNSVLDSGEWQTFECKRALIKPAKLLETVCAFANSSGGLIVIGLEDPDKASRAKRYIGIGEAADNVSEFYRLMAKEFDPPLLQWSKTELPIKNVKGDDDVLALVKIGKAKEIHSLKNGDTYIRNGRSNTKIGSSEIIRLKYEKGTLSFESEANDVQLEDLDSVLLDAYKADVRSESSDDWQFLKDNGFALKEQGGYRLTNAGVMVFGKNPSVLLKTKVGVRISHYHGTSIEYSGEPNLVRRPFTIEGPASVQIKDTLGYFKDVVRDAPPKLVGASFTSSLMIPEWAFQEAITNAVIHRNYSIPNDIQVRFFDDHVEVESPGILPGFVDKWNIRDERFARNPIIQRGLGKFSDAPNLDIGEGVDRMYREMYHSNLYEPIYLSTKVRPNSVHLFLLNKLRVEYWDTVRNYLEGHSTITNSDARRITGIKDSVEMSRLLKQWVESGLIEKTPNTAKRNASYKLAGIDISLRLFSEDEKINEV